MLFEKDVSLKNHLPDLYCCTSFKIYLLCWQVEVLIAKNTQVRKVFTNPVLAPVRWVIGKLYVFCFMGYCLAPFSFFSDFWAIYRSVYFMGFVFFLGWRLVAPFLMPKLLARSRRSGEGGSRTEASSTASVDNAANAHPSTGSDINKGKKDWDGIGFSYGRTNLSKYTLETQSLPPFLDTFPYCRCCLNAVE